MRRCTTCHEYKEDKEYGRQARGKNGLKARCRFCTNAYRRRQYEADPALREKAVKRNKAYTGKNLDTVKVKRQEYAKRVRTRRKDYELRTKYGINLAKFEELKSAQNNLCGICTKRPAKVVEHCHKTNKVRSIACSPCNTALGLLKEDLSTIKALEEYIKIHATAVD